MQKILVIKKPAGDPKVRDTPNGASICAFTIAVNRRHLAEFSDISNDDIPF